MNDKKIRVFLTGATGVMGSAGLLELMKYPGKYDITVLARPSKMNRKKLKPSQEKGVKVIWGDLLDESSLRRGVENADIVLHVGGMVSPAAEHYPEKTLRVNVGSMRLIAWIVKELEEKDAHREIKTVYIGSVSQYGNRLPPDHWGKVGDNLRAARLDAYALSKILAERALVEAGLKKWVSVRQTSILHGGLFNKAMDPVTFHVPLDGVLEWISIEDSGRLLERICRKEVPESFWCNYYNMGGGESFRLSNLEFERAILKAIGCPAPERIFDTNWFAKDNFHGIWFEDSAELDAILHYRGDDTFERALERLKRELPFYYRLAPLVPAFVIKKIMKKVACKEGLGTLYWLATDDRERIEAAWGSKEEYAKIPDWKSYKQQRLEKTTAGDSSEWKEKRGLDTSLRPCECEHGHRYFTSEALEAGGHGCPECLRS